MDRLDSAKVKNICSFKDSLENEKISPRVEENSIQIIYLTKDLYPKEHNQLSKPNRKKTSNPTKNGQKISTGTSKGKIHK